MLEKARLTKQVELNQYLTLDPLKRSEKTKQAYFVNSKALYKNATAICIATIKKFPKYNNSAEVQYIIAQNYIEQNNIKDAKNYLERAIKNAAKKI